jgi:regulator of protease activity HflC (stomatin/prohibitin superfamily)
MSLFMKNETETENIPLVKYTKPAERPTDFFLGAVGLAILALLVLFGLAARLLAGAAPTPVDAGILVGSPILAALAVTLFPRWSAAIKTLIIALLLLVAANGASWLTMADAGLALAFAAAAAFVAPAVQKTEEWERAIVLRFGKLRHVKGPGLFILIPVADRVARKVDLRIRVTDFSAETTLTRDSVTITVDALCFWLVWDAEKAICEVEDYEDAVILSAKTALRAAVSENDLTVFLERGDEIEARMREEVDQKTTEWGITVQHIEITDIQIPEGLQDSISRLAQAEREKKSRVLLAEAEIEIARKFEEAAKIYGANEIAMKLKSLSVLNEGLKAGNSMMLVPNSITEELKSRDLFGLQALNATRKHIERGEAVDDDKKKEDGHDRRED